jgi:hypothetical protein
MFTLRLQVKVSTEKECALGLSFYPDFAYNAEGGGGVGACPGPYKDTHTIRNSTQEDRFLYTALVLRDLCVFYVMFVCDYYACFA